jgi:hypothetical protein
MNLLFLYALLEFALFCTKLSSLVTLRDISGFSFLKSIIISVRSFKVCGNLGSSMSIVDAKTRNWNSFKV